MNLEDVFAYTSEKMKSELQITKASLSHSGSKGSSVEMDFKEFLKNHLPDFLDICSGEIIDHTGKASKQLDVIICDKAKTPKLFQKGDIRVVPIECVYSVIEVKTFLNSQELEKSFQNMKSVRELQRVAYYVHNKIVENGFILYGKEFPEWSTNYFIFALDSDNLSGIAKKIDDKHRSENLKPENRIDMVCVLEKGVILNKTDDKTIDALPTDKSKLLYCETDKALLLFYSLMSRYLNQARIYNPFNFVKYLGNVKFGDYKTP